MMMVHGDRGWVEGGRAKLDGVVRQLARAREATGVARHGGLVAAFIEAAALTQALADAEDLRGQAGGEGSPRAAAMALLMKLARLVGRSWASCFADSDIDVGDEVDALRQTALPEALLGWDADGFAHHRIYPEAHREAAIDFAAALGSGSAADTLVIGVAGVGTGLAAIVAATIGASAPAVVRVHDTGFGLEVTLPAAVLEALRRVPHRPIAIVDGGRPFDDGAMRAVADALIGAGIAPERLNLLPTAYPAAARGTGDVPVGEPDASAALPSYSVETERLLLHGRDPQCRLSSWIEDLTGPLTAPLEDLSYGRWRERRFHARADWPPADPGREQLKFLAESDTGPWLIRFVGLGREGERRTELARTLAQAGFTPPVAGFRHGFLVERWIGDAGPLDLKPAGRPAFVAHVGRYLGFRTRRLRPPRDFSFTPLDELLVMARRNTARGLGEAAGEALAASLRARVGAVEAKIRPAVIDGRLQPWEWLARPDGQGWLKADAVDHHAGHELVGGQDIAWDVAGAICEFDLSESETSELTAALESEAGEAVCRDLVAFLLPCYAAYQLGRAVSGATSVTGNEDESVRMRALALRYARRLERALPPMS